jgi:16S rRNA (cytosine967-C5)-methyltransferase
MNRFRPRFRGGDASARSLALQMLLELSRGQEFISEIMDRSLSATPLSAPDRRLATFLTFGVVRRRATLDALLGPRVDRPLHRVEPWLLDALRLGVYQLALMSDIPPHAALHESVELAAAFGRATAKGFLNGILRSVERVVTRESCDTPGPAALPDENGGYRRLTEPLLPDPGTHPIEYLAAGFSLPEWLAKRWLSRYSWEECLRLGFWFAGPASLYLRSNALRVSRADFLAALVKGGIEAAAGDHPQAVRLAESAPIRELPGYDQGWFAVQDEAAMRVASALAPEPGSTVLDMCAAPGGKTTHLAELMENRGRIVACDVDDQRLETLSTLCRRLGVGIVEARRLHPEQQEESPAERFDAILVDVPCSNTGVLGRRPEVRWRLRPSDIRRLVMLQAKLLQQAGERIRRGGAIVYSTCSIEPEENGEVVRAALKGMPDLMLEAEEEQAPGRPADGGYWARLRRRER